MNTDQDQKTSLIDSDDELTPDEDSFSVSECLVDEEELDCASSEIQIDSSAIKPLPVPTLQSEVVKTTNKNKPINKNKIFNSSIINNNKFIDKLIPSSHQNKTPTPLVYINHPSKRFSKLAHSKKARQFHDLELNINSTTATATVDDDKYSEMLAITQISLDPRPHSSPHSYSFPRPFESKRSSRSSQGN